MSLDFLVPLYGGIVSRLCGGMPPKLPFGLDQILYSAPYAIIVFLLYLQTVGPVWEPYPYYIWFVSIAAFIGAFIGKRAGHGNGIDLGTRWGSYESDFVYLCLSGLTVTIVPGGLIALIDPIGYVVIFSGFLKGPAYAVGWMIYPKGKGKGIPQLNEATQWGEFLTGIFGYLALSFLIG